jgi:hypothetical protein
MPDCEGLGTSLLGGWTDFQVWPFSYARLTAIPGDLYRIRRASLFRGNQHFQTVPNHWNGSGSGSRFFGESGYGSVPLF